MISPLSPKPAPWTLGAINARTRVLTWPDSLAGTLAGDELATLRAEHERLSAATVDAQRTHDELLRALDSGQVARTDAVAAATALRAGKPVPPQKAVREAQARLEEARHALTAHKLARDAVAADVRARMTERQDAYVADVDARLAGTQDELRAAIEALRDAAALHEAMLGLRAWLTGGRLRGQPRASLGRGQARSPRDLIPALSAAVEAWMPAAQEPEPEDAEVDTGDADAPADVPIDTEAIVTLAAQARQADRKGSVWQDEGSDDR